MRLDHTVAGGLAMLGFIWASQFSGRTTPEAGISFMPVALATASPLVAGGFSQPSSGNAVCPKGTRAAGKSCVLDSDLVLAEALQLEAFTTLNCRGHRILPSNAGAGTTPDTYVPSVPAVGVWITGDREVDVRNCVIGEEGARFDFGIVAINSKHAGRLGHRIHNNEIHARDSAITFLGIDDARVNDNVITWSTGFGISFVRDSDRNRVNGNVMSSAGSPPAAHRIVPDGPFRTPSDVGIFLVAQHPQPLYNLVIAGWLYQFPNSEDGQYPAHEDNVLEGNRLSLPGSSAGKGHEAIEVGSNAMRTRVTGNTITEAGVGIRLAGFMRALAVSRPGRCVNSEGHTTTRFCQTDADCFISEIDVVPRRGMLWTGE
jgi:hypothetical protein